MKKSLICALALFGGIVLAVLAGAVPSAATDPKNQGAAEITLDGGTRGNVSFPHRRHQQRLNDCQICHATFPQTAGSINALKDQEKLAPRQVMNKLCIACHKAKKREGTATGPTTCSKCHHR